MNHFVETSPSNQFDNSTISVPEIWSNSLLRNRYLLTLLFCYLLFSILVLSYFNAVAIEYYPVRILQSAGGSFVFFSAALSIFAVVHVVKHRPRSPFSSTWKALREEQLRSGNLPNITVAWLTLILLMPMFVEMKAIIPLIQSFSYDVQFQQLDKWLHFGTQPDKWLRPLLSNEWMIFLLQRNYYLWFPVVFTTYCWQAATTKDPLLRQQFLITFAASWIVIGTIMATLLSSAGPIYFDRITGGNSHAYGETMALLENAHQTYNLMFLEIRDQLWNAYEQGGTKNVTKGISAMPSMHVALSYLLILFGWRKGKLAGISYTIFGVLIMLSSVLLLWHYAIDGYVSIVVVSLIWWVSGIAARRSLLPEQSPSGD